MLQLAEGKGPFTSTGIESLLYMKVNDSVNADPELPDIELLQSFATIGFDTGTPYTHIHSHPQHKVSVQIVVLYIKDIKIF